VQGDAARRQAARLRRASKTEKRRRNRVGAGGVGKCRGKIRGTARNSAGNSSMVFAFHARARALAATAFQRSRRGEFRYPLPFCPSPSRTSILYRDATIPRHGRRCYDDEMFARPEMRGARLEIRSRSNAPKRRALYAHVSHVHRIRPGVRPGRTTCERNMGVSRRCSLLSILRSAIPTSIVDEQA